MQESIAELRLSNSITVRVLYRRRRRLHRFPRPPAWHAAQLALITREPPTVDLTQSSELTKPERDETPAEFGPVPQSPEPQPPGWFRAILAVIYLDLCFALLGQPLATMIAVGTLIIAAFRADFLTIGVYAVAVLIYLVTVSRRVG